MKSKKKILEELKNTKKLYNEELNKGHLYSADALKQRGYALCWVLGLYWSDIVPGGPST